MEIALAQTGGGRVDEVEREWEHGRLVWSVEITRNGSEVEVDVDAATGEVVEVDRDADRHGNGRRHDED